MLRQSTFVGVLSGRRWWVIGAVMLAAAAVGLSGAVRAPAAPPCATTSVLSGSNFEIDTDANMKVDGTGDCIDWLPRGAGPPPRAGGTGTPLRTGVLTTTDKASGATDDAFGQGSSENDADPTIVAGSIPPNK